MKLHSTTTIDTCATASSIASMSLITTATGTNLLIHTCCFSLFCPMARHPIDCFLNSNFAFGRLSNCLFYSLSTGRCVSGSTIRCPIAPFEVQAARATLREAMVAEVRGQQFEGSGYWVHMWIQIRSRLRVHMGSVRVGSQGRSSSLLESERMWRDLHQD